MIDVHVVAATVHLVPALLWGVIGWHLWRLRTDLGVSGAALRVGTVLAAGMGLHFVLHALIELTPTELGGRLAGLHAVIETVIGAAIIGALAIFRHMLAILARGPGVATTGWLATNYGIAGLVGALAMGAGLVPGPGGSALHVLPDVYALAISAVVLRQAFRLAHRGGWRPGPAIGQLRSPDLLVIAGALVGSGGLLLMLVATGSAAPATAGGLFLHTAVGVGLAVPFVVRMLGRVMRSFVIASVLIATTAVLWLDARALAARAVDPETAGLIELGGMAAVLFMLVPGRAALQIMVDGVIFRRSRHHEARLQAFVRRLPPELGVRECCRGALAEIRRVAGLRGAAIILADGSVVAEGDFVLAPLERAWPRDGAAAPIGTVAFRDTREAMSEPVREALLAAEVTWIAPIASPRRGWGHLFVREWLVTAPETVEGVTAFVGQLALVLDAADLLARAVAVERSLAHAEKLAAIGELTARIAHDIRNPVSAARSLAQQLVSDRAAPFHEEHALILDELGRVERQVASLLRFARREEFRFEPVDVAELARATVDHFRPRLESAGIDTELDLAPCATAHADREKIRHVLINLIENAIDALAESPNGRRLSVAVGTAGDRVTVRVADSGAGVAVADLPHLFEPFFSRKTHGTGLGLAIAKRTVDAHAGRIVATSTAGCGTTVELELPVAPSEDATP